jgi:hypothetical protein
MLFKTSLAGVLLALALALPLLAQQGLSQAEFQKLHDELTPEAAAWEAVPWRLSMLEACAVAAKEKKPVYMLVRSGHPLGCV